MNSTEEVTFEAPAPKAKKKKARAKKAARETGPKVAFPGLTHTACADTCNANGCAISGKSYCAHPVKGGLQPPDKNNPAALKRMEAARDQLAVRVDPDRFK